MKGGQAIGLDGNGRTKEDEAPSSLYHGIGSAATRGTTQYNPTRALHRTEPHNPARCGATDSTRKEKHTMTQKQEVLKHLQTFGTITTMQAYDDYDITRLSARVYDLRQDGYLIENKRVNYKAKNGRNKHYDIYIYRGRVA